MSVVTINQGMKVIDTDIIQVTKNFAENNLSSICLKMADNVTDTHYEWTMEAGVYMLMFELPAVFKSNFLNVTGNLNLFCSEYVEERGLNSKNLIKIFEKNLKKKLVFRK